MEKIARIAITGGRGLVGSALVDLLTAEGFSDVVPVGREECDLSDVPATRDYFAQIRPDYVFHAAARVYGIMGNMKNQGLSFYDNNLINTAVVDAAHRAGVKKITVMGTGAIYPFPPASLPLREATVFDGRPHPSESGYAHAKRAMLAMLEAYTESYGTKWAYIASCNLFGPRDKFDIEGGHVVPSLIAKFRTAELSGGPVSVWGDGSAQRDFMYVKDAARVALTVMEKLDGVVNMGSGSVWSIRQIVDALGRITGLADRIVWDASKPNGQAYRAYDLTRLSSTGFTCRYPIEQGLAETWDWYRAQT
ncbi:MAG: GDP-L-fucose synthase [Micropepsaceae bacterium]